MLTSRAWWLLATIVALLAIGLLSRLPIVAIAALALLLWFTGAALLFTFQVRWTKRDLRLRRDVYDDRGVARTLWADRAVEVQTSLSLKKLGALPYVQVEELIPFGAEIRGGVARGEGRLSLDESIDLSYDLAPLAAGRIRFEGAKVQFSDLQGLFYHKTFVRLEQTILVLPALAHGDTRTAAHKNQNVLMPPGINQLALPGSGSELLDLRDYIPGDPPKTIAWKVSARRDKLITKEYESEVPLRCTLFLDASRSVQFGPPGQSPYARLVEIAASVTQANLSSRDLTGLCIFDEENVRIVRPARSRRHLIEVLHVLAQSASKPPVADRVNAESLVPLAYSYAEEVYPELVRANVNQMPWWAPLIAQAPSPAAKKPDGRTYFFRGFVAPVLTVAYVAVAFLMFLLIRAHHREAPATLAKKLKSVAEKIAPENRTDYQVNWEKLIPPFPLVALAFVVVVICVFPVYLKIFREVIPMVFSPGRCRLMRYRKQMAALLAERYDLGPGGLELLYQDDKKLGHYLQQFLCEHRVPFTPTLHDEQGRYALAAPKKIEILIRSLLNAVAKGRDNELFVLLVDLIELEDDAEKLTAAVKVALARHHKVILVLPWPSDLAAPREEDDGDEGAIRKSRLRRLGDRMHKDPRDSRMAAYLEELTQDRYLHSFWRLRKALAKLQVPVLCAAEEESVEIILDRLDRLRGQRRQRISTV